MNQLEQFAKAVHVPFGYLFLKSPPVERLPIPDFRTIDRKDVERPSPDLLEMVEICQLRQIWYHNYVRSFRDQPLPFVESATIKSNPVAVSSNIRKVLDFKLEDQIECGSWTEAFRIFNRKVDEAGILVLVSGIVMSNSHRRLDPKEFRGFLISDLYAPLIFINGSDSKSAQMFTLAHELAHVWLGKSALSNLGINDKQDDQNQVIEAWCNQVAAETLVPRDALRVEQKGLHDVPMDDKVDLLAKRFKVSTLVVLRRLLTSGDLSKERFKLAWKKEYDRLIKLEKVRSQGGDFYNTTLTRVNPRFARALIVSALEGNTLYRDAYMMLGIKKTRTFNELGQRLGVL